MQIYEVVNAYTNEWFLAEEHSDYHLGGEWIPCTSHMPRRVTPRPGCEDGIMDTMAKYMVVYHKNEEHLQIDDATVDRIIEYHQAQTFLEDERYAMKKYPSLKMTAESALKIVNDFYLFWDNRMNSIKGK